MKSTIELIRDLRTDHDLSQAEIAEVLGTTQQYYSKYETGSIELPLRHFAALADYYHVSADYLLGRSGAQKVMDEKKKPVTKDYNLEAFMNDFSSLDKNGRKAMVEYLEFLKYKQEQRKHQDK